MSKLLVSIIIPNYNYSQYLLQAVDSVLAQSYPLIEIIVVDDGSTDNSVVKLKQYDNQIRCIRQQNKGVASARNRGVQESRGELIAFLDADDFWLPGKLDQQVKQFQAKSELGMVHCGVIEFNELTKTENKKVNGQQGWVADELLLLQRPVILGGGSGLMIRRTIFEEMGGFDTQLSTSADWDLFYRISRNYQVGFVAEPQVMYRMHSSNMHGDISVMERDMLLGYQKAFSNVSMEVQSLRRRAYGKLHLILAGSYFQAGQPRGFLRHFGRSLLFSTEGIGYLLKYPLRQWERSRTVG